MNRLRDVFFWLYYIWCGVLVILLMLNLAGVIHLSQWSLGLATGYLLGMIGKPREI